MNYKLHNQDLQILQAEARGTRFGLRPAWTQVDWKPTRYGGNMVFLRRLVLPPTCSVRRTDIKIEAPPNLYEPSRRGRLAFYPNVWISPDIKLRDQRTGAWLPMPRLYGRDEDGFGYLCVKPDGVEPGKNVLEVIRVLDLFLLNPGYKASFWEQA